MLESKVEDWMREQVRRRGGAFYKFVSPGTIGVPDRIILRNGGRVTFVELKQDHGRLSEIQKVQIGKLRALGADVRVVYGRKQAEELIDELFPKAPPTGGVGFGIEEWR